MAGVTLRCPVCGTEFVASGNTVEETRRVTDPSSSQTRRPTTQDVLLERFRNEPPEKKPVSWATATIIIAVVLIIAYAIVRITARPDVYAPMDSVTAQKLQFFQPIIDSLTANIATNPTDAQAHLHLADAYYDIGSWLQSEKEFETYLAIHPDSVDARVDYAYTIAQASGDLDLSLREIDTGLIYNPNHINALLNGGILAAQMMKNGSHEEGLAKARDYFERARNVAQHSDTALVGRIDKLIESINQTGSRPAAPKMQ